MSKRIKVIDDFLSTPMLVEVQNYFQDSIKWVFGSQSDRGSPPFGHWNYDFLDVDPHNQKNFEASFLEKKDLGPLHALWLYLKNTHLRGHQLVRCYANAHTYGVDGYPHVDSRMKGNFTTLIYLNPQWDLEWGGETLFFSEAQDIVKGVMPKAGRVTIFDGRIQHVGRGVSRRCPALRVVLIFKTRYVSELEYNVPKNIESFLLKSGAAEKNHSHYTLLDHLKNTYIILKDAGAREEVCLAGLFHSVYGTTHFRDVTISNDRRNEVAQLIGKDAERLVWGFCQLNRPEIFEHVLGSDSSSQPLEVKGLTQKDIDDLIQVECANILEQKQIHRFPMLFSKAQQLKMIDKDGLPA